MVTSDPLPIVLWIIGLAYIIALNFLVLSLSLLCGLLIYEKWVKHGRRNFILESDQELRKKIAIAAALTAVKIDHDMMQSGYPIPATALVSAWQAVMRSNIHKSHRSIR